MNEHNYLSLQGKLYAAERTADGKRKALAWLGNFPDFTITPEVNEIEHTESYTGNRGIDLILRTATKLNFSGTCEKFSVENLALALHGQIIEVDAGSVTDEDLPNPSADGDLIVLDRPKVSSVVLTDSAGTPATLAEDTNYKVESADFGRIELVDLTGFTQPIKAAYSHAASKDLSLFNKQAPERWLEFHGVNTVEGGGQRIVALYRGRVSSLTELALIHGDDALANFNFNGVALVDTTKDLDSTLGQFGYMRSV